MRALPRTYYTLVIVDNASDRIVGVGAVFIERKFLRGLGSVGHIEDIAVDKSQQGKKLGLRIIQALTHISENSGCYKTILNCSDANIRTWSSTVRRERGAHSALRFTQLSTKSVASRKRKTRWWVTLFLWWVVVLNLTSWTLSGQVCARTLSQPKTVNPILSAPYHMDFFLHTSTYFTFPLVHSTIVSVTILDIGIESLYYQSSVDILKRIWFSVEVGTRVAFET